MSGDVYNYGEIWEEVPGFPRYQVSTEGRIYNAATKRFMKLSPNNFGHPKISLLTDYGQRYTRSVAFIVAKVFIEPPNELCDRIIHLNGDLEDVRSENLAWRPRWFGWRYARQMKVEQPEYYKNQPVVNLETNMEYENVIEAGLSEGLLFDNIYHAAQHGNSVFPTGSVWAFEQRV